MCHSYIPMNSPYSQSYIYALAKFGLAEVVSEYKVEFKHAYFQATRRVAICNMNATCNMSPAITELFLLVLFMVGVQGIGYVNGIAKYILSYVSKFDECNRVKGSANANTGALKVGS